jgi:acyl dehydratase
MSKKPFSERKTFLNKEVGFTYRTPEMEVTDADLDAAKIYPEEVEDIFGDDEFTQSLGLNFKGRIIPGVYLILLVGRLEMPLGLAFDAIMVAMSDIKFLSPAYVGDHFRTEGELISKRKTSKGHTMVSWKWVLKNNHETNIASGVITEMFASTIANLKS